MKVKDSKLKLLTTNQNNRTKIIKANKAIVTNHLARRTKHKSQSKRNHDNS